MATKHKTSFITRILLVFNLIFVLCLLGSYLAPYVSPEKNWILAFFGLAYPVFFSINLLFVIIWGISLKKYFFISLLALLGGYNYFTSTLRLYNENTTPPKGSFMVMTYNVHSLYGVSKEKFGQGIHSEVTEFIASQKPGIVCIQEFLARASDSNSILPSFGEAIHLPYYAFKNYNKIRDGRRVNGMAIFSKYPVIASGSLRLNRFNVFALYADMAIGRDTVRVYNLHLKSISLGPDDYTVYSQLTEPEAVTEKQVPLKEGSIKIIKKLKNAFILRARQVDILASELRKSPYPIIICGDFNDTPCSYTYKKISEGLEDSFRGSGRRSFGNTYSGKFPSFRIDYILHNKMYKAYGYKRYNIDLSDHYPVSVHLMR